MLQWVKGGEDMRDFPVFTTEHGVGSLILKEIPYLGRAFVKIHDVSDLKDFLDECIRFARIAGAEEISASGHADLTKYPFHTAIIRMRVFREGLPDTDAALFPVTEQTCEEFRLIYNKRMGSVPNASFMTQKDAADMLEQKEGYFIHRGETLLGIGMVSGSTIRALASCLPGVGEDVVLALNHALTGDMAELEVASQNQRAVSLYRRLGFVPVEEVSRWYKIF